MSYPKPANRTAFPVEVAGYTFTTILVVLFDVILVTLYIIRRKHSPVKQRPLVLSLLHRCMMPGIALLGIARIYPESFPCGVFFGCYLGTCLFGALGDIGKALYVYFEYCASEDLLKLFTGGQIPFAGGNTSAMIATATDNFANRKGSKTATDMSVTLDSRSVYSDDNSLYSSMTQTIKIRMFIKNHLSKIVPITIFVIIILYIIIIASAFTDYAASKVADNQCSLGEANVPLSILLFLALITSTMHFAMKKRMSRVQDNFGLREDFDDLTKPTTLLTLFSAISLIPQVYTYAYENYLFYEQALQVASIIASVVICGKPAMKSFSKEYQVVDKTAIGSNRNLDNNSDAELYQRFLNEPNKSIYFESFLIRELSVENFIFRKAVLQFKSKPTKQMQHRIYNFFIGDDAISQVNLPSIMFEDLARKIKQDVVDGTIFDAALQEIEELMFRDAFLRFLQSKDFERSKTGESSPKQDTVSLMVEEGQVVASTMGS
jgi:hypothetical protein